MSLDEDELILLRYPFWLVWESSEVELIGPPIKESELIEHGILIKLIKDSP